MVGGQRHAPATLPPGRNRYPLYRRLGGPQGRSGWVRKISPPPGFDPRTIQPVASRYSYCNRELTFHRHGKYWHNGRHFCCVFSFESIRRNNPIDSILWLLPASLCKCDNYYYRYSALGPVWAETRVQSGDWYGSGTLHPGQVLRGSLPLLSPAFRRSHFRHQVSPRPSRRKRS